MANILFTRLCRELNKDDQTGRFSVGGECDYLTWMDSPIGFVMAIYWLGYVGERFSLSYSVRDEADNILDAIHSMEFEFYDQEVQISTAFFYAAFPHPGRYQVNIYHNGIIEETIPLQVIESSLSRAQQ
jgi:hypothetical protein